MSKLDEIQCAIEHLPKRERYRLRSWFFDKDNAEWDAQIESDLIADRLKDLATKALLDLNQGTTKSL
jgi:hypothetical protein